MTDSRAQVAARALREGGKPYGIDLTSPGGVEALIARHRSVFGGLRMSVDAGDGAAGGGAGGGDGAAGAGAGAAGAAGAGAGAAGAETGGQGGDAGGGDLGRAGGEQRVVAELAQQREANRQLQQQIADLRRVDDERRRADEADSTRRVRNELEGKLSQTTTQVGELRAALILRDARDAAVLAGVPSDRWQAFSRHVDLQTLTTKVGDDGTVPLDDLKAAVDAGLEEAPEFRTTATPRGRQAAPGSGAGAGRTHDDIAAATAAAVARMRAHLGHPVTDGAS